MFPLRLTLLVVGLLIVGWAGPARAWIELSTVADNVTIDVERDGSAVVAHEMMIRLRGGPLKTLAVEGVDRDAAPMPDATITRARSGRMAGLPIPLTLEPADGRLEATVQLKKGLRGGSYLVRFRYRTDFAVPDRITSDGPFALLRWQSPRLDSGIDSMRVLFRLPRAEDPPRLLGADPGDTTVVEEGQGVFLSTVRQGERDEIEIVRPHVAKGEVVTWKAHVDRQAFDMDIGPEPAPSRSLPAPEPRRVLVDHDRRLPLGVAGLAGLLFALLVALKFRTVERVCRERGAASRPLVPLGLALRAALAGGCVVAAVWLAWACSMPTLAGCALAAGMLLAASLPARLRAPLRGPGSWEPVDAARAFAVAPRRAPLMARLFDAGDLLGFAAFLVLLGGFVAGAASLFQTSAYHAIMLALGSVGLFPLFCTGRAGELPADSVEAASDRLEPIFKALVKRKVSVGCVWRIPASGGRADELRLAIELDRARRGLVGIEVGCDMHRGAGGVLLLPFVIVRVHEATEAMEAMPTGLLWTRGRTADERVAVLRPRLPTRRLTTLLVLDVVGALRAAGPKQPGQRPSKKAARSRGKGESTAKPSMTSSPVHAT